MKIITRAVLDWDGNILEEDSYEYHGEVSSADPMSMAASAAGGVASGLMGGGGGDTQTQTSEPWGPTQDYVKQIMGAGQSLYDKGSTFFDSQTFAPLNQWQQQGLQQQQNYGQGLMPYQIGHSQGAWGSALNAPDVANNPYIGGVADTMQDRLNRNLTENVMPGIQGNFNMAGQYGGEREDTMRLKAGRDTQMALSEGLSGLYGNAYGQGLEARGNAMAQSGNQIGLGMLPGQTSQGIGNQLNAEAQKYINESMARHTYAEDAPWDQLTRYQNVIYPAAGMGQTATGPNPYQTNTAANVMGGAMMGNSLFNQLGGGSSGGGTLTSSVPNSLVSNMWG